MKYKKFWNQINSRVDYNSFNEIRFQTTCTSVDCLRIMDQRKRVCTECTKLSKIFTDRANTLYTPSKKVKTPHKFKSNAACNTAEKAARLARQREIKFLKRQNERLKLRTMIEQEGVDIDEQLDGGLTAIVDEQLKRLIAN